MGQASFLSNNIHLWLANLRVSEPVLEDLCQNLSLDERRRSDQFAFSQDRRNFVASRGILRNILARYTYCQPQEILFRYSPENKPSLVFPVDSTGLEFNLSHSSGFLAVAVTKGLKVGVDIEHVRWMPDMDNIAFHSFSEYERNIFSLMPEDEKPLAFFRCWTRKEAYIKALGNGLSIPLDSFDVSFEPDNPIDMLSNRLEPHDVLRWSFYTFVPLQGFIGALVIEGPLVKPSFRQWEPEAGNPD